MSYLLTISPNLALNFVFEIIFQYERKGKLEKWLLKEKPIRFEFLNCFFFTKEIV